MKRLHVVGCPRSGTTLLMEMLSACFHFDARCSHEVSIFAPFPSSQGIFLSKQPTDVLHVQPLLEQDEALYVIYIFRDPRAVVTSKHRAVNGYFANFDIWKRCEAAARQIGAHEHMLQLRYEDLIAFPDICQNLVQTRFPFLARTGAFEDYYKNLSVSDDSARAMNGLRPLDQSCFVKWQGHLSRLAEQLARFPELQAALETRGYEPNASWQRLLQGVDPVVYPCRYSTRPNVFKTLEKRLRFWIRTKRYLSQLARRHAFAEQQANEGPPQSLEEQAGL